MSVEMILPIPISQVDTMRGTGRTMICTSCTAQGLKRISNIALLRSSLHLALPVLTPHA